MNSEVTYYQFSKWADKQGWLELGNHIWITPTGIIVSTLVSEGNIIDIGNLLNNRNYNV